MKSLWLCLVMSFPCAVLVAEPIRVGVFDVDVSPPVGTPLAYDPCVGVAMSLRATGVVIVGSGDPIVLCAVDWIGIANDAHKEWCRRIARAVGTANNRVTVHTLHQHDAPVCDFSADAILAERGLGGLLIDTKFAQQAIERVSLAAAMAKRDAVSVTHIGIGESTVVGVASNRRILGTDGKVRATRYTACTDPELRAEPVGTVDPQLKSISFWADDVPVAVLTYFATHPQSYYRRGIANPDFPGMARFLRQVTLNGVPHVHFNGAGGNIGAGKFNDGSPDNRQVLTTRLADAMAKSWKSTERNPLSSDDVTWTVEDIVFPAAPHLDEESLLTIIDDATQPAVQRGIAATHLAWFRRCARQDTLAVSCLRLGDATIVHMPGEAVIEYQLFAQQQQPDQFVAVAAYGDYGTGYVCLEKHYEEGGYEASPAASRVAANTEPILKGAIRRAMDSE